MRTDVAELFNSVTTYPISDRTRGRIHEVARQHVAAVDARGRMPLAEGDTLGPYVVEQVLGSGGQAVVYRGRHGDTGRLVALKVPRKGIADRLLREARLATSLQHPAIVRVEEIVPDGDPMPYMVMELCEWGSLETLMEGSPHGLPLQMVRDIAEQLLEAIAYAHDKGIVHRDIKPGNVLFGADRKARLADFGIGTVSTPDDLLQSLELTEGTAFAGTPLYMAPEQGEGKIDGRADLFAFGKLVFHMLTGLSPRTIRQVSRARRAKDAHPDWDDFVYRLVEERPGDRFGDARTALIYLQECVSLKAPPPRPGMPDEIAYALQEMYIVAGGEAELRKLIDELGALEAIRRLSETLTPSKPPGEARSGGDLLGPPLPPLTGELGPEPPELFEPPWARAKHEQEAAVATSVGSLLDGAEEEEEEPSDLERLLEEGPRAYEPENDESLIGPLPDLPEGDPPAWQESGRLASAHELHTLIRYAVARTLTQSPPSVLADPEARRKLEEEARREYLHLMHKVGRQRLAAEADPTRRALDEAKDAEYQRMRKQLRETRAELARRSGWWLSVLGVGLLGFLTAAAAAAAATLGWLDAQ